ncbi:MAG: hypothetical protein ACRCVX_15265 [Shewanella sp.]
MATSRKGKTRHSDDVKASVMAALLSGQSVTAVAEDYKMPQQTVSRLKAKLGELSVKKEIPDLVAELLETNLNALKNIAEQSGRENYIKEQSASDIAVLYGVIADKSFRILTAIAAGQQQKTAE